MEGDKKYIRILIKIVVFLMISGCVGDQKMFIRDRLNFYDNLRCKPYIQSKDLNNTLGNEMNRDKINKLLNEIADLVKHDSYLLNNSDQDSLYTRIQNLKDFINETYIRRGSENVE